MPIAVQPQSQQTSIRFMDAASTIGCRPPPEVIRVPPTAAANARTSKRVVIFMLAMIPVGGFDYFIVHYAGSRPGGGPFPRAMTVTLEWVFIVGTVMSVISLILAYVMRHKLRKQVQASTTDGDSAKATPIEAELRGVWADTKRRPKCERVMSALSTHRPAEGTVGRVVVIGDVAVPEVGEIFFEPVIYTPVETAWFRTSMLASGAALALIGMIRFLGATHPIFRQFLFQGGIMIAIGVVFLAWKSIYRPRYLRLAPGIIEVVQFPTFQRGVPEVTRFPVDEKWIAIVEGTGFAIQRRTTASRPVPERLEKRLRALDAATMRVTLIHGEQKQIICVGQCRKPQELLEAFWRAALSTARRPEMNPFELTG